MSHIRFCTLFLVIFISTVNVSYAAKGKVGSIARLDSDSILLISDKPIRSIHISFKTDDDDRDLDVLKFIQALEIELYRKKFDIYDASEKADLDLSLKIKKLKKNYWAGLPGIFGQQRQVECLSVEALYETNRGKWKKHFIAHKGYWTYTGDSYHRDTTKNDLARAIINPLHNYPKEKAFISAAGNGDIQAVYIFLEDSVFIDADNDFGYTPLIAASKNGHGKIMKLLISYNANVNAKNDEGWSSLAFTAYNGDQKNTVLLLNSGARVNTEDYDNISPLDLAVLEGHNYIAILLLSHNARVGNALALAKQKGNKELEEMLSLYAEKEKQSTSYDCGYLYGLITSENEEKIQFLIENDLLVMAPEDDECKDVMIIAAKKGNNLIIDSLLTKGFDVNAENDSGEVPLIEAAAKGHKEVVEMLLSKGADLSSFGSSALAYAAMRGQKEIVEYLLLERVDVNALGKSGQTLGKLPLGEAARAGQKEMIKLLLSNGAGINTKNNNGKTALMTAAVNGNSEIVDLLLSKGADINQEDEDGNTVSDLVSRARIRLNTIDYRDVVNSLKREKHKRDDEHRTLISNEWATF